MLRRLLPLGPRPESRRSVLCHLSSGRLARPGDHSAREPPDPIPNSAVKPCCAQGTALLRVGERVVARPSEAFGSKRGRFKQASGSKRVQRGVRFGKDAAPRLRARTRSRGPGARPARGQPAARRGARSRDSRSPAAAARSPSRPASRSADLPGPSAHARAAGSWHLVSDLRSRGVEQSGSSSGS